MQDPVVVLDRTGQEVERTDESGLLGGLELGDLLDSGSLEALRDAVLAAPTSGVELVTLDGRFLDATVLLDGADRRRAVLRDVTRYAGLAQRFGGIAVALARRNRDLRTLHEAAAALDATLDLDVLARSVCETVATYLDAEQVLLDVVGLEYNHGGTERTDPASGVLPLRTPRGQLGEVRWWRQGELLTNEQEVLPLLVSRAAIGLDHALLLSDAEDLAARDPLTGLLNRRGARHALAGLVPPFAVVLIDLDHFKRVNDELGHDVGDRVLCDVAAILQPGRSSDVKARWGGEEFLVALDHVTEQQARLWTERRLAQVATEVRAGGAPVTFSAGVAAATRDGLDAALIAADRALYEAKAAGRSRVVTAGAGP